MDNEKIDPKRLEFNNHFKKASFAERLSMDQKFYDKKYSITDFKHSLITDRAFIKALISKYSIPKNASLLDIGCGTGWYSYLFAELGLKVTGIDFSRAGIFKAKDSYGNGITWVVGDGCNMPFKRKFDVLFCSGFSPFSLVDNLSEAINIGKSLFEYLKKDGYFIFQMASDLSNKRSKDTFMNYSLEKIRNYFLNLDCGEIIGSFVINRQLFPILKKHALSSLITRICIIAQKIHHKNVKLIVIIKKK